MINAERIIKEFELNANDIVKIQINMDDYFHSTLRLRYEDGEVSLSYQDWTSFTGWRSSKRGTLAEMTPEIWKIAKYPGTMEEVIVEEKEETEEEN